MTEMNGGETAKARARELMRCGNHYAAQNEWGRALIMFEDAVKALESSTQATDKLRSYALAHLADATVQKLVGLYQLNQIVNEDAIPLLKKADELYDRAPEPSRSPWALAHRGELQRIIANCIFAKDEQSFESRIEHYETSIEYFCEAIKRYRKLQGVHDRGVAWACAHLGAAVVNARAFIGLLLFKKKNELKHELKANTLKAICRVAGLTDVTDKDIEDMYKDLDKYKICLKFLQAATKLLLQALGYSGFYYPWAHAYYGGCLLLQGALARTDQSHAVDIGTLASVVISQAYYLDPRLLAGVFEPTQLSVNPPLELALIHYAKVFLSKQDSLLECQKAWAFAWIALKWPFKFAFLEGLQTLTICSLLAQISDTYIEYSEDLGPKKPAPYGLLPAAGFASQGLTRGLDVPQQIINNRKDLNQFIHDAFEKFKTAQLDFFLKDKNVKLNSNLKMSLSVTLEVLAKVEFICTDSKIKVKIKTTRNQIQDRLGLTPLPQKAADRTILNTTPNNVMFSLLTQDAVSIGTIYWSRIDIIPIRIPSQIRLTNGETT